VSNRQCHWQFATTLVGRRPEQLAVATLGRQPQSSLPLLEPTLCSRESGQRPRWRRASALVGVLDSLSARA
jgi:hypothetical protein